MTFQARPVARSLPWLLAALSMIGPFSIDAIFPAFPLIGQHFAVDDTALQQLISAYLIMYGVMCLFHGAISDAIGRKPVIVSGMLLYCAASAVAALSTSFTMLLAARAVQGASAGAGIVVGRAIVRDSLEGAAAQKLMSRVMMIFATAPAIAPMVGGQLLRFGSWHGMFWLLTGFTAVLAAAVFMWLEESHPASRRLRFAPHTLLAGYLAFGRDRGFWPLTIASSVNFAGLFLYIASAPRIVRELLGLSALGFPWLFVPVVAGMVFGAWLSGRLADRCGPALIVGWGYAALLSACALHVFVAVMLPQARLPWSVLPLVLHGIGVQLAFPTLTLLLLDRFPQQRGGISSVQAFSSLMLTAVVAGVLSPLLSRSMLGLAMGATGFSLVGWVAWMAYRHFVIEVPPMPLTASGIETELQSDMAEPR